MSQDLPEKETPGIPPSEIDKGPVLVQGSQNFSKVLT